VIPQCDEILGGLPWFGGNVEALLPRKRESSLELIQDLESIEAQFPHRCEQRRFWKARVPVHGIAEYFVNGRFHKSHASKDRTRAEANIPGDEGREILLLYASLLRKRHSGLKEAKR
jgi:hypothetical protein